MKNIKIYLILFVLFACNNLQSHDSHSIETASITWKTISGEKIQGHFFLLKNDTFYIEKSDNSLRLIPINNMIPEQKKFILNRQKSIDILNSKLIKKGESDFHKQQQLDFENSRRNRFVFLIFLSLALLLFVSQNRLKMNQLSWLFSLLFTSVLLMGFGVVSQRKFGFMTRESYLDSAFNHFKPTINTWSDAKYYYVESNGLPDHETMLGITAWQQQVPIPQCYIGKNAWPIPLNPVIATSPVPVNNKHFLRGAIAVAVNGIPIFNPYTNTGVDAFLDGQLDQYGGHSGRADDYHYHIAPEILFQKIPINSPVAFALDGFAIYGTKEPDGSNMLALDSNHGHFGQDGSYHYHTSKDAPYMIKNMVGKITEDSTLQIIPQSVAKGVRPALTPLKGATITHNIMNANKNGFTLSYMLNGRSDTVRYTWTPQGAYTYEFMNANGYTKNNYQGQPICNVPLSNYRLSEKTDIQVFASGNKIHLLCSDDVSKQFNHIEIIDLNGRVVFNSSRFVKEIESSQISSGVYFLRLMGTKKKYSTKFLIL